MDYDVLILDLLKLDTKEARKKVKWRHFISIFNFESAKGILSYDGEIIVIGDPRFNIIDKTVKKGGKSKQIIEGDVIKFLDWSGLVFYWDNRPGTTIITSRDNRHKKYLEYLKYLKDWKYSLSGVEINKEIIETFYDIEKMKKNHIEISIKKSILCQNRYKNYLAFKIIYQILKTTYYRSHEEKELWHSFGSMIFLPKIKLNEDETLLLILEDICGIEMELPEPKWLEKYTAPGQAEIDTKIKEI